jgi:hypothetical protein
VINMREHPVGWAQLMDNLEDAHEHLGKLIKEMQADPKYADPEFAVDLGHVVAHLNRAWFCRDHSENLTDAEWELSRGYPKDLEPIA